MYVELNIVSMTHEGRLIVIEGIDGAGKTTVSKKLCETRSCSYMTQPEDTWVGDAARKALDEDVEPACDLFLHMAAHANQQAELKSELKNSDVIMDRYYHSRIAYQSVQTQFSPREIRELHRDWSVEPSDVAILDISPADALERKRGPNDKFEKVEFLSEVRSIYLNFFDDRDEVVVIDASQPPEEVHREVESEVFG